MLKKNNSRRKAHRISPSAVLRVTAAAAGVLLIADAAALHCGDIVYRPDSLILQRGELSTALSKRLGDLLELFVRNPGQTLSRQTILLRVWGMETEVEDGNLDNYVYFLRRSLRKVGSTLCLTTVRGVGYRMEEKPQ